MKINILIKNGTIVPYKQADEEGISTLISTLNGIYTIDLKEYDSRTQQQNKALPLYFKQIANSLNAGGNSMTQVIVKDAMAKVEKEIERAKEKTINSSHLSEPVKKWVNRLLLELDTLAELATQENRLQVEWDSKLVKDRVWRPIQKAKLGKASTTKLNKKDIDEVYLAVNNWLASSFGIDIPFPMG